MEFCLPHKQKNWAVSVHFPKVVKMVCDLTANLVRLNKKPQLKLKLKTQLDYQ